MTPRQMYSELSKIAGHRCTDGRQFVTSHKVTRPHMVVIQQKIVALLEKLSYSRTRSDFGGIYHHQPRMSRRRLARVQQIIERDMTRGEVSRPTVARAVPGAGNIYVDEGVPQRANAVREPSVEAMTRVAQGISPSIFQRPWHVDNISPTPRDTSSDQEPSDAF